MSITCTGAHLTRNKQIILLRGSRLTLLRGRRGTLSNIFDWSRRLFDRASSATKDRRSADHANSARCLMREIYAATANVWTAIVDNDVARPPVAKIFHR
jgi:hypothetical protein